MSGHQTSKKLHFGGPIGQLKFQGDDVMRITSNGAECYGHLITMLKANSQFFFAGKRSQMKPYFISSVNDKLPIFISASYGDECYRHSFPTLKTNTRHLFLASYGAECYRNSFPTLKTNTRHLFLASYRAECYRHSFPTLKTITRHLFKRHTETNDTVIHFRR